MAQHELFNRYQIDQLPWYWWPFVQVYGWTIGLLLFLYSILIVTTSRIRYEGFALEPGQNYIYCFWHRSVFNYQCLSMHSPEIAFITHPSWYMKPAHVVGTLKASRVLLGSSGFGGKAAADELVSVLRLGKHSTYFNPDGPDGPPGSVRKGALHVSMQTGLPLVGIHIECSRKFELNGWDRKQIVLPFSTIIVTVSQPFMPDPSNLDDSCRQLAADMGATSELETTAS